MNGLVYMFAAFTVIWGGTLLYLLHLASLKRALEVRLERLEKRICPPLEEIE